MSRFLLILVLTLTGITVYGQSTIELKTSDGRTVILKPDGTWEYKKETPQQSTPSKNSLTGDNAASVLPKNFFGHDPKTLFNQLTDLKQRLKKDEFETTAQFETRIAQEKQKPLLGTLTVSDSFTFVISQAPLRLDVEYNADSQKMTLFLPVWKNERSEILRNYGRDKKTAYDLSDVNLYRIDIDAKTAVFFDELNDFKLSKKFWDGFMAEISLNVDEAKNLKNKIYAAILVKLEEPYAVGRLLDKVQFQIRLVDVYFFDQQSGRILAKMSQPAN